MAKNNKKLMYIGLAVVVSVLVFLAYQNGVFSVGPGLKVGISVEPISELLGRQSHVVASTQGFDVFYVSRLNVTITVTPHATLDYTNVRITTPTTPAQLASATCSPVGKALPSVLHGTGPLSISCYVEAAALTALEGSTSPFQMSVIGYNVQKGSDDAVASTTPLSVSISSDPTGTYTVGLGIAKVQ